MSAHWCAPAAARIRSGHVRVGAGHPGGDGPQVVLGQGGGAEVAAQVVRLALADQKVPSSTPFCETANANASARRMAVAGSWQPSTGDQQKVDGTPPMCCGLNTWHRAEEGADRAGELEDVGLGGGGDDRAGVAQDDIGEERGLVGAGRGHHQQVLLERDVEPVPVVGAAEEDRVLARVEEAVAQREGGADPGGAAQRGEAAPAQPQAERGGRSPCRGAAAGAAGSAGAGRGCRAGAGRAGTPTRRTPPR